MKRVQRLMVVACLAAAASSLAQVAFAQANPRIGTWKLDLAKSTYQQGTAPRSETRTYLITADGGVQMTADAMSATGTKQPSGYRAKYDGKDYPFSGAAGDTIALVGNGRTTDATIKMGTKVTQRAHSVVSKDGKTMTQTTRTAAGNAVSTRVYNKQ